MNETPMREWLERASISLNEALEIAENGDIPKQNLYKLAPLIYSKTHHMNNDVVLKEMTEANDEQVSYDWSVDEQSKFQFKFHYVSSYLFCYVIAGKIDEKQYDKIMNFVSSEMELFT